MVSSAASSTRAQRPAALTLLAVCVVWGSTFVVVKDAVARMPVAAFLAWRFALASVALLAVRPRALRDLDAAGRRAGGLLGLALGAGYLLQTVGLQTTGAAVSGFLTGLFVVLTPLGAAVLLRQRPGRSAWLAVLLAAGGLALLSLHSLTIERGQLLLLGCAAAFALHIVGLGRWAGSFDSVGLAVAQLLTVTVLCAVAARGSALRPPPDAGVWGALVLTALLATAGAFLVQTWAQARLPPTRAAVIMTMEPVFAGAIAVAAGERLGLRTLAGAALVLLAMLVIELGPRRGAEGSVARLEV